MSPRLDRSYDLDVAAEIERAASDPRFVQVLLNIRTRDPLGKRKYWRLYEAACEHGLPVAIHVGGMGGNMITASGLPSYYIEEHAGFAQAYQAQVASLVFEGVFEEFPRLRIVLQEGGFAWIPALGWRMDRAWELLHEEVPHLSRPPSQYLRRHFWYTTQPIEEPNREADLAWVLDQMDLGSHLLFSTDYPHWDFDAPGEALPASLGEGPQRRVYSQNARALYGLS